VGHLKKRFNTLFIKIILTVIIGIVCLTVTLSFLNIGASKDVYVNNFVESQEKIFNQIDQDIYNFFRDIATINDGVGASSALQNYITKEKWESPSEEWLDVLAMQKSLDQLSDSDYAEMNMVIVGVNGRTLNFQYSLLQMDGEAFLELGIVRRALEMPRQLICEYISGGFTDVTKNKGMIVTAKAIRDKISGEPVGVTLLSIAESDFCRMYTHFTGGTSDIIIFNQNDEVISSNKKSYLAFKDKAESAAGVLRQMKADDIREMEVDDGGHVKSCMMQKLQSTNYTMLGITDPSAAFINVYDFRYIMGVTLLTMAGISIVIFLLVRQQTRPLSKLVHQMEKVRDGDLERFVEVSGTTEIRELAATYNTMLVALDNYIRRLVQAEQAKREAEIKSLQMQINPHYIYNTLASVKWLIWQGDKDKSVKVIDAFITLLRNTISNKQDMITLKQEIENLKNYVLINQIRYGSQVSVEYFVMPQFEDYKVPKLILQPFVENAFFHAFPEQQKGNISIFVKTSKPYLIVEIIDDGVGIEDSRLSDILSNHMPEREHFTGIGINNVDERIKLIYGNDYGIDIKSQEGKGTTVTVRFPEK